MSTATVSRPGSRPPAGTANPPRKPSAGNAWIDGPVADLLLYVGTPALVIPAILGLWRVAEPAQIYLFVAAFGALGHHLPGMMRAYGDTALFRRFRTRFIVAPIFLLAVCIGFAMWDVRPVVLVTFAWGIWHGAMQAHGMCRIYDAKVGSFAPLTARLDHLMVLSWFGAGVAFSSTRIEYILEGLAASGIPLPSANAVLAGRLAWAGVTGLVTLAFLWNAWRCRRAGTPQNPVKFLLLSTTFATWIFANVAIEHILIGIVVFEIVHDVQYLGIVWRFNRGRADKDPGAGSFTRFLFRRSGLMVGVYLVLIAGYGSLRLVQESMAAEAFLTAVLGGVLAASTLLHFYYDGFIWKMREQGTRETLGLEGAKEATGVRETIAAAAAGLPGWARHGLKWSLFVVPLCLLTLGRLAGPVPAMEAATRTIELAPESVPAHFNLAVAQHDAGDHAGELETLRRARALPSYDAEFDQRIAANLTWALVETADAVRAAGDASSAASHLAEAAAIHPDLSGALLEEARAATAGGDLALAEARWRSMLLLDADDPGAHYQLALLLERTGRADEALPHAARVVELAPAQDLGRDLVDRLQRGVAAGG